jgi:hypothetical protein
LEMAPSIKDKSERVRVLRVLAEQHNNIDALINGVRSATAIDVTRNYNSSNFQNSFAGLISAWQAMAFTGFTPMIWEEIITISTETNFSRCLSVLTFSTPILQYFGGEAAVDRVLDAIIDVGHWWP